jgi:predicted neutral ceramidase superfamily lipid hydrolase
MVSGLREKILSALSAAGFHESEVFTTDTHAVSAVVLGHRGYHPLGEAINQEALINHIKQAALTAASRLETCKAGSLSITVPKVRVIGGERLEQLTLLIDKTIQKAKKIIVPVFALEGLLLVLLLAFL